MSSGKEGDIQPFTVFVEGNVGSGKSTFLNFFRKFDDFHVLAEPIEKWKNLQGHNLLDLKFNDPERFQFSFQSYATVTRLRQHIETTNKPVKIMERSLLTARRCFVENLYETGSLDAGSYHVMNEWYEFVNEFHPIHCNVIVYLRTSPEVASARVKERAREEEAVLSDDYLLQLHQRHEKLFRELKGLDRVKVITVDADKDVVEIQSELDRCKGEILQLYKATKENQQDREVIIKI